MLLFVIMATLTNAQYASPEDVEGYLIGCDATILNRHQAKFTDGSVRLSYVVEFTSCVDGQRKRAILAPRLDNVQPYYWVVAP